MPLSISNSDYSSRKGPWIISWLLVILMVTVLLGSYEQFLKAAGHRASIDSNQDLWSWHRFRSQQQGDKIVLLGASRMQLDINTDYLRKRFPQKKIIELSINGQYPMASLKALAEDQQFVGTVIMSINAQALESRYLDMQISHNDFFKNQASRYRAFDAYLSSMLEARWRFLHPKLSLEELIDFYDRHHVFFFLFYMIENPDLSKAADFSLINADNLYRHFVSEKLRQYQHEEPAEARLWAENIDILNSYTDAIVQRGGQVILVRLPTDKGHWLIDEQFYPRADYWTQIAENSHAASIHFKDVKGLEQFDLLDSSHLDQKDSEKFTRILFDYTKL